VTSTISSGRPVSSPGPPQYTSLSSASKPPAQPSASTSSNPKPTLPPQAGIRLYELLPTQLQREVSPLSETEPETEDEVLMTHNQRVSFVLLYAILSSLMGNRNRKKQKETNSRYVFGYSLDHHLAYWTASTRNRANHLETVPVDWRGKGVLGEHTGDLGYMHPSQIGKGYQESREGSCQMGTTGAFKCALLTRLI
jgi:hypothetical protein